MIGSPGPKHIVVPYKWCIPGDGNLGCMLSWALHWLASHLRPLEYISRSVSFFSSCTVFIILSIVFYVSLLCSIHIPSTSTRHTEVVAVFIAPCQFAWEQHHISCDPVLVELASSTIISAILKPFHPAPAEFILKIISPTSLNPHPIHLASESPAQNQHL